MGFKKPTDIQFRCIPAVLAGQHVMAVAQTGTGKTCAFVIPVLSKLDIRRKNSLRGEIRCIVLVPTRELAEQITGVFKTVGKYTGRKIVCLIGGVDTDPQIHELREGTDVLVTTPGRFFDLHHRGYIEPQHIEIMVVDEADRMLERGFFKDLRDIKQLVPGKPQVLFFSATLDKEIRKLAYDLVENPLRIQISPKDPVSANISHACVNVAQDDKRFFLERLLTQQEGKRMLVFVRTKVRAERVQAAMLRVGIETLVLHGEKDQEERRRVLKAFASGEVDVMVATDVSARGIDIAGVQMVVNYDVPEQAETYIHRIGRTGRGQEKGAAITFVSPEEKTLLKAVEERLGKPIEKITLDNDIYQETVLLSSESGKNYMKLIDGLMEAEEQRRKRKRR